MGYFLLSWSLLFCGVSLLGYPREMPYFKKKRLEAIKGGDLPTDDAEIGKGWRDMIRATLQLFKNITYICSTLGLTVRTMYGVAIGSFFAKILVLKFGGSSYVVGIITGCVMVPGMFRKSLQSFKGLTITFYLKDGVFILERRFFTANSKLAKDCSQLTMQTVFFGRHTYSVADLGGGGNGLGSSAPNYTI